MIGGIWWIGWPYVFLNNIGILQQGDKRGDKNDRKTRKKT
jgi:hypothetical protein